MPLTVFIRNSKMFMRLNVFFKIIISAKCSYCVFIFHETFVLVNAKLLLTLINLIFTRCERATVAESLRV